MPDVFKALADPSRRQLLDQLFRRDGQPLGELVTLLPEMTRFGVMKHLGVLEEAALITTRKVGREKLHYLNPVPIRQVFDRWTSKYAKPFTRALTHLKYQLEQPGEDPVSQEQSPRHVYEIFIRTTPEKLWAAITQPEFTKDYFYGGKIASDWKEGSGYAINGEDGKAMLEGKVLEIVPQKKLVTTFSAHFLPSKDRPSRVTWEIEQRGEACRLTLVHDDFDGETATFKSTGPGWNPVLSGLKTLLETGKALVIAPPPAAT